MVPRVILTIAISGVVALQSAAGTPLRSNGAAQELAIGDRRTQAELFCNSIGCPDGFTPIPEAWTTVCDGECTVDACCEAFCSYHACPDGFTQISNADTTLCTDDLCTTEQCCEAFCSYYPCPNNYVPISDASTTLCADDLCTTEQCCELGDGVVLSPTTSGSEDDTTEYTVPQYAVIEDVVQFCNSIGCPDGFTPIPEAWTTECDGECSVEACCEAFCSYHACPDGFTPISSASTTLCTDDLCTTEQCCEAFCSYYPCPNGFTPILDASTTLCADDLCTTEQCCD